jgi:hypothetical protein
MPIDIWNFKVFKTLPLPFPGCKPMRRDYVYPYKAQIPKAGAEVPEAAGIEWSQPNRTQRKPRYSAAVSGSSLLGLGLVNIYGR